MNIMRSEKNPWLIKGISLAVLLGIMAFLLCCLFFPETTGTGTYAGATLV